MRRCFEHPLALRLPSPKRRSGRTHLARRTTPAGSPPTTPTHRRFAPCLRRRKSRRVRRRFCLRLSPRAAFPRGRRRRPTRRSRVPGGSSRRLRLRAARRTPAPRTTRGRLRARACGTPTRRSPLPARYTRARERSAPSPARRSKRASGLTKRFLFCRHPRRHSADRVLSKGRLRSFGEGRLVRVVRRRRRRRKTCRDPKKTSPARPRRARRRTWRGRARRWRARAHP